MISEGIYDKMEVLIDLCVVPIGVGVSLSKCIAACKKILTEAGLKTSLHSYGTELAPGRTGIRAWKTKSKA